MTAVRRVRDTFQPQTHHCGRKTLLTESRWKRLLGLLTRRPYATLVELGVQMGRQLSTIDLWLSQLGWSFKKTLHHAERSRPDVAGQRKQWPQRLMGVSAERLMFMDQRGANTQMTRRYGRSPIARRLVCSMPHRHHQTTTLIAAVRLEGPEAPRLFGGAMDG